MEKNHRTLKKTLAVIMVLVTLAATGCSNSAGSQAPATGGSSTQNQAAEAEESAGGASSAAEQTQSSAPAGKTQTDSSGAHTGSHLVAIDAGHQAIGDNTPEPVGPGASETKARVTTGTTGVATSTPEYQLTLILAQKLDAELTSRGYRTVMTRTTSDVNISNSERAAVANNAGADAFVRIHADGSDDPSVNGAMTICQTPSNPYNGTLAAQSRALATDVLDGLVAATGCRREKVWQTDTMSGINWCNVPVTIVEAGYMTNRAEDLKLADAGYQQKIVQGIADGIDSFFSK